MASWLIQGQNLVAAPFLPRFLLLVAIWILQFSPALAGEIQILHRQGDLFVKEGGKFAPTKIRSFPPGTVFQAGPSEKYENLEKLLSKPPASMAAILIPPGNLVTLSSGAEAHIAIDKNGRMTLGLSGAVHLLLAAESKNKVVKFLIEGVEFSTSHVHLFYNGWSQPARLTVVSGAAKLVGVKVQKAGQDGKGVATAILRKGETLVLNPEKMVLEIPNEVDNKLRQWAQFPGFETPGNYKRVGNAFASDKRLTIVRYGQKADLKGKAIPLMEGDELFTRKGQIVRIRFDNGDGIKLFGKTKFHIERHVARKKKRNLLYRLFGKMRAFITKRKDPSGIRFNTSTATIGVKGTDFEIIASVKNTEVSVVEGLVGVANPAGLGEVNVPAGSFTTVPEGQLPAQPSPLSSEKLEQLRTEGIPPETVSSVSPKVVPGSVSLQGGTTIPIPQGQLPTSPPSTSPRKLGPAEAVGIVPESISILSPTNGQVIRSSTIVYEVVPLGAVVEVLLDGKVITAPPGTALPPLSDGQHTLAVKAAKLESPLQSVSFTVDTTPPAPAIGVDLNALTLKPNDPLVLTWGEPLQSIEVTAGNQSIPVKLSEDGTQATLMPDRSLFQPDTPLQVRIKVADRAGNQTLIKAKLFLQPEVKPPVVIIATGEKTLRTRKVGDLNVTADQEVKSWSVMIDGKDITSQVIPPGRDKSPSRAIVIHSAILSKLSPGEHTLTVKVTDEQQRESEASLKITLLARKTVKPKPPKKHAPIYPGEIPKIRYEGTIAFDTEYLLDDMYLIDRGRFMAHPEFDPIETLIPPQKGLGESPKIRYEGTIAFDTEYLLDDMYLIDRGRFMAHPGFDPIYTK